MARTRNAIEQWKSGTEAADQPRASEATKKPHRSQSQLVDESVLTLKIVFIRLTCSL